MTRVLIFSPYALWGIHTIYEETIAKACAVRGAAIEYLLCDGLLPECDQHWDSKSNAPRPFDLCQRCQKQSTANINRLGFSHKWLGQFIGDQDRSEIFTWAQELSPADLRSAVWRESRVGEWVLSSVISYFRQYPPDFKNWHVINVYRGFIFSGAIVATALERYLAENEIDSAILFNGRQSITRVAFEVFRRHEIRVLTHERAEYLKGHVNVRSNAHCMNPDSFKAYWNDWAQIPLKSESLNATLQWLIQRRYGANLAWIPFNKSFAGDRGIRERLGLSASKRLWVLFTSSTDEVAGDPVLQGPYQSQAEWVRDVIQWVRLRNDIDLVIKVHPNLGGNVYIGKATDEVRVYQEMIAELPANVRIVMPDDVVNAYSLADEAEVGLTFGSTIGLEMAMLGKQVLLASRAIYESCSSILVVKNRQSLPSMLEKCLHASTNTASQREAFRLAYYYIFEYELPFPAISVKDIYDADVNYRVPDDIEAGKDKSLDHICNFVINGSSLHDSPSLDDLQRTSVEEDAFFKELARGPEYLVNAKYERWIRLKSFGQKLRGHLRDLPFGVGEVLISIGRRSWYWWLTSLEREALAAPAPERRDRPN